jgi:transcriptional regulator with XRE-family HTH domain
MLQTPAEWTHALGARIQARRAALGLTQAEAARRSGVSYSTWRRMETQGRAAIEDLVRAALVLRCEQHLDTLFPPPVATSMDDLLKAQKQARTPAPRRRASPVRKTESGA